MSAAANGGASRSALMWRPWCQRAIWLRAVTRRARGVRAPAEIANGSTCGGGVRGLLSVHTSQM